MSPSQPSSNLSSNNDSIHGVDINKDLLYGEYLDQERTTRALNNEIKRKTVHKALDLPMDDPMNITTTTNHNYPAQQQAGVNGLTKGLIGAAIGALVPGGALLYHLAQPVTDKIVDQVIPATTPSIPSPQEAIAPPPPIDLTNQLQSEVDALRKALSDLENRKYTIRHFTGDGKEIFIPAHPVEQNQNGNKPATTD